MTLTVGTNIEGEITHIADFGAFVSLGEGKDGLIHISEIANEFVKDIHEFVTVGDKVTVRIIGINKQGKFELSLKQAVAQDKDSKPKKMPVNTPKLKTNNELFEDKLNTYLKKAEEKQIDLRRNLKKKQGITKKKR